MDCMEEEDEEELHRGWRRVGEGGGSQDLPVLPRD
jgi:hypothetical protein